MVMPTNSIVVELDLEEAVATARMLNTVLSSCREDSENERTIQVLKGVVERLRNAIIDDLDRVIAAPDEDGEPI